MRPLDAKTIRDLRSAVDGARGELLALETPTGVAITNRHLFIEWPFDLVEDCGPLHTLFKAAGDNNHWVEVFAERDWRQEFVDHCDFLEYEELDPGLIDASAFNYLVDFQWSDEDGIFNQDLPYIIARHGPGQVYYHRGFVQAIEAAFDIHEPPELVLYEEVREGRAPAVLLVAFDRGALVGVLLNTPIQHAETLVDDPASGKSDVIIRRPK